MQFAFKEIPFLAKLAYKSNNNTPQIKIYRKPTDRSPHLYKASEHQPSLINSKAYGQALILNHICSEEKASKDSRRRLM